MSFHKKLRFAQDVTDDQKSAAILPEIELEIAIRKRVAQTLEARIAWAQRLRDSLIAGKGFNQPTLKDAALDALAAIEKPLDFIHDRVDPSMLDVPSSGTPTVVPKLPRPPPKPKIGKPLAHSRNHGRFLFTRSGDQLFILACPSCQKIQFSSLQGLYNHARISHQLEWGTHEDCVRACSVPREEMDTETGVEITVTTSMLGVRGLFQKAVEANPTSGGDGNISLNATLGLHAETPALASVLGKTVRRREIRVYDEDDVDIDSDALIAQPTRWRVPRIPRSVVAVREEHDSSTAVSLHAPSSNAEEDSRLVSLPLAGVGSRFHILTRVIVTDRSMSLLSDSQPPNEEFTHRWMISVEAPSYSLDITTILQRVTASSLSDHLEFPPLIREEPPFIIMGLAKRPFLCRLELLFNPSRVSSNEGQPVVLEHWVDLDTSKVKYPVQGEEQLVDVELHKETIIQPPRKDYVPVDARVHWKTQTEPAQESAFLAPMSLVTSEYVPRLDGPLDPSPLLRNLLPDYPLTLQDSSRPSTILPYSLASSHSEFSEFTIGRQKAIEWGRAKAIRDAAKEMDTNHLISLSTADVFRWLRTNAPFLPQASGGMTSPPPEGQHCLICGLSFNQHDALDLETGCSVISEQWRMTRLPIIDIDRFISAPPVPLKASTFTRDPSVWSDRHIVSVAHPTLLLAIKDIVDDLRLPSFPSPSSGTTPLLESLGTNVHRTLAPYGILTLVVGQLIRRLISGGLKRVRGKVITPTHVIQALVAGQTRDRTGQAMFYALSRLGRRLEEERGDLELNGGGA